MSAAALRQSNLEEAFHLFLFGGGLFSITTHYLPSLFLIEEDVDPKFVHYGFNTLQVLSKDKVSSRQKNEATHVLKRPLKNH